MGRISEESGVEKIVKTEEIFEYVQKQYGTVPEYLWSKSPDSVVLRHKNGKWYAVFMTVEKSKLGLRRNADILFMPDALNLVLRISLKSYYYWLSKIRKLALEELPRKKNGIHMCTDQQSTALTESPAEFAELSLPDRNISRSTPAAILHIGSITLELYEGTSAQMLENILKAVQSC